MRSRDDIKRMTTELRLELLLGEEEEQAQEYRPVPNGSVAHATTWRVRFDPTFGSHPPVYLELNAAVTLGRVDEEDKIIGMFDAETADQLGLSRTHAQLRPTTTKLFLTDLHSTNGTFVNGSRLTPDLSYDVSNGDRIRLGRLETVLTVVNRPMDASLHTGFLGAPKTELIEIIPEIARAITAHSEVESVLKQAIDFAAFHVGVQHMSAWLVDEKTGVLSPVVWQYDGDDEAIRRENRALAQQGANFISDVVRTAKPVVVRKSDEHPMLANMPDVNALFCMPLMVGDVAFGAIAGIHDQNKTGLSQQDEQLLSIIAEFASIAAHNSLQLMRLRQKLKRRDKMVTALNYILSHDLKPFVRKSRSSTIELASNANDPLEVEKTAEELLHMAMQMSVAVDNMVETSALAQNPTLNLGNVDLLDVVASLFEQLYRQSQARGITLERSVSGEAYLIVGDESLLERCLYKLLDNVIRYCPRGTKAEVKLHFGYDELLIYVRDTGPGFPPNDLQSILDEYYRGARSVEEHLGLGLGLEYVRIVVEAHRGSLIVRNADDGGAEFIITLPGKKHDTTLLDDTMPRNPMTRIQSS